MSYMNVMSQNIGLFYLSAYIFHIHLLFCRGWTVIKLLKRIAYICLQTNHFSFLIIKTYGYPKLSCSLMSTVYDLDRSFIL